MTCVNPTPCSSLPVLFTCHPLFLVTRFFTYLENQLSCLWCEYPSTLVPGLLSTAHPLLLLPPWHAPRLSYNIYLDDINNTSRPRLTHLCCFTLKTFKFATFLLTDSLCPILFWILMPFFLLIKSIPGFAQNFFEKKQMAACCFLKRFRENLINKSTNRKIGIALSVFKRVFQIQKGFMLCS